MTTHIPNAAKRTVNSTVFRKVPWFPVLGALSRLHHYRDVHTRMVHDMLHELDCGQRHARCEDD